jgi:Carboxypeptidase regulatory-like domain
MPGAKQKFLKRIWIPVFICGFFIISNVTGSGQATRIIHGMVVDSAGQPVTGAVVTLFNLTDSFKTFTNLQGKYTFGSVRDTAFTIRVESEDFKTFSKRYISHTSGLAILEIIILTRKAPVLLELPVTQ